MSGPRSAQILLKPAAAQAKKTSSDAASCKDFTPKISFTELAELPTTRYFESKARALARPRQARDYGTEVVKVRWF